MKQDLWGIIEELEAAVAEGMHIPLSDRVVVSEHEMFALLDELRAALPDELSEARALVEERDRILSRARSDADRVVTEAKEYAEQLTAEATITERAEDEAEEILTRAEDKSHRIMVEAHKYADEVLEQLQDIMERATDRVGESRKELRTAQGSQAREEAAAASDSSLSSRETERVRH